MAIYDNHSIVYAKNVLSADLYAGNSERKSLILDMKGFHSLEFIFNLGYLDPIDSGNIFTVRLFENDIDDEPSSTLVDPKYVIGDASFTGLSSFSEKRVGYVGKKRYVQVRITIAGNTEALFSITALQGRPNFAATDEN